jgi:hypothetical protein
MVQTPVKKSGRNRRERGAPQVIDRFVVQHIRRHRVERVADGPQQQAAIHRMPEILARKIRRRIFNVPRPDHSKMPGMLQARMSRQRLEGIVQLGCQVAIACERIGLLEQLQRRECGTARQWIARV